MGVGYIKNITNKKKEREKKRKKSDKNLQDIRAHLRNVEGYTNLIK